MNIDTEVLFAALANPIRLRCLMLLHANGELCVCELTHALKLAQPTISRHLAQLREAGLVSDRREGLWIHYRIHPDLPEWAQQILQATHTGSCDRQAYRRAQVRLDGLVERPGRRSCA